MLYEYAKYKGYDVTKAADLPGFVDQGSVSDFAFGPMQWAVPAWGRIPPDAPPLLCRTQENLHFPSEFLNI